MTPWIVVFQAPLSMGFSMQSYWHGLPFPPPEDLYDLRSIFISKSTDYTYLISISIIYTNSSSHILNILFVYFTYSLLYASIYTFLQIHKCNISKNNLLFFFSYPSVKLFFKFLAQNLKMFLFLVATFSNLIGSFNLIS